MRMRSVAPGHVQLRHRPALRWVLLALGALLSWYAIDTAIRLDFARAPVLAAALGLLLLLGGFVAVRWFVEIEIWPTAVTWSRRGRLGFGVRRLRLPRSAVVGVRLGSRVVSGSAPHDRAPRPRHTVELMAAEPLPSTVLAFEHRREARARDYALALCRAAQLPLHDETGDSTEVCDVAALGGPPSTRLPRPDAPPPPGVVVTPDPVHGEFVTLRRWFGLTVTLAVVDEELRVDWHWSGVPLRRRRITLPAIERVRVQQARAENGGATSTHVVPGVAVRAATRTLVFGSWLPPVARRWVRAWLEATIWPAAPVGAADVPGGPAAAESLPVTL
ncbi:MAG: hypothetical protein NXI31_25980 [bacterium]|nr:hypothetical protein [bacterium]